ncbi:MAG: 30S ribosomal protein S16 [Bifidobacteriaceae bacterium]|nr:30S ribosomal protein S16 [Bifidobacteriaceae bacterium]
MSTRIRLKRTGKIHYACYRVVVVDQRKKRDGRVIEEVGTYDPNPQPSTIHIKSDRVQYWLGLGAQPSDPVLVLLKITGDWQKFKGLPGAEGTLKVAESTKDVKAAVAKVTDEAQKLKADKSAQEEKAKKNAEAAEAPKAEETEKKAE